MTRHRAICTLAGALVIGASLVAARPGSAGAPKQSETMPREYVVKLDTLVGRDIASLAADYDLRVVKDVLASRGIYLLAARSSASSKQPAAKPVRDMLAKDVRVEWVELNEFIDASDDRFHAWPNGAPRSVGVDPGVWLHQAAVTQLRLDEVHQLSTGRGVIVAILDTGIDRKHPVFANQLVAGWDYVDDDQDPTDRKDFTDNDDDGVADEAFGHGTHVAGILSLVAPSVKILPARVLDADGRGNVFAVAEAIHDVVESGARVINLSFGTDTSTESHLLRDAIADTQHSNVIVVASAGNTGTTNRRFPAAFHKVVAVAGIDAANSRLASFSNRGAWVGISAPASSIVSSVPGGGYASWSGTSMAAPFVAGQLALMVAVQPTASTKHLLDALYSTSAKLNNGSKSDPPAMDILAGLAGLRGHG